MEPVASSRAPDRRSHTDNAFHWVRPKGVRSVHLWLCQAGGGGKGGSKHATGTNGANGASKMFRVDQSELTFMFSPAGLVVKVISMVQGILASRGGTLLLTGLRGRQRAGILP